MHHDLNIRIEKLIDARDTDGTPRILALGGGKGGVGKTVIAASLGVGLATLGKRVVLIDADLGSADLHTVMGIEKPARTIVDFLNRECERLSDVLITHPSYPNLKIICSINGPLGMANLPVSQKWKLIRHIKRLDADFVILDLGAGSSYDVLDFFLIATEGIVVVNPDPLSILESYHFVKMVLFRYIARLVRRHENAIENIRAFAGTAKQGQPLKIVDLIREIHAMEPRMAGSIDSFLSRFQPRIIINKYEQSKDEEHVLTIRAAAREILAVEMEYLGTIRRDEAVVRSLDRMVPFISHAPHCKASRDLTTIVIKRLLDKNRYEAVRTRRVMRKTIDEYGEIEKDAVICSIKCQYWEDCGFRCGGFPCQHRHLSGIPGFRGD